MGGKKHKARGGLLGKLQRDVDGSKKCDSQILDCKFSEFFFKEGEIGHSNFIPHCS